jgi:glycosyltransferase involved in cell wall biosynthesis
MIVKNGAATIARAIASVRQHVDEVNVYDTGSTDGTLELLDELASEPGAPLRVEHGEWRDDYAWAREQSFAIASPDVDWLLWMDDDDDVRGGEALRRLDELPPSTTHVYLRRDVVELSSPYNVQWMSFEVRLTRPGACRWVSPVHELLKPPAREELAFVLFRPSLIRVEHPPVPSDGHDEAILAAVADTDCPPHLLGLSGLAVMKRRGDYIGAEAAMRRYLDVTAGRFDPIRHNVYSHLADLVLRRDRNVAEGSALVLARDAELEEWRTLAAAGELSGLESLGPDCWHRANAWRPPSGSRNDACPCGSGVKLKRCCADRVFLRPADLRG